jgi:hypothetical protein
MKSIITFGALSVIAATICLFANALEQSGNLSLFTTLSAVRDLVEH